MSTEKKPQSCFTQSWDYEKALEDLEEAYANVDPSQSSLDDILDDEKYIEKFKEIIGLDVYLNRGYDAVETQVRKQSIQNGKKLKAPATVQYKAFLKKSSRKKTKHTYPSIEQLDTIKALRKWLALQNSKNMPPKIKNLLKLTMRIKGKI